MLRVCFLFYDFTDRYRLLLFLTKAHYTLLPALPRVLCNQEIRYLLHFYLVVVANVNNYFQHCLCHYEASITGLSSSTPYKISTGIIVPVFPYPYLPVGRAHHKKIFILSRHKVTCKLLLPGVCGRPFNCYYSMPTILFARISCIVFYYFNCLPSFVKHSMLVEDIDSRHTRFMAWRRLRFLQSRYLSGLMRRTKIFFLRQLSDCEALNRHFAKPM